MQSEISLFSQKPFIDLSRKFVCVRLGSYECLEHQTKIRSLLRGTFQNTAFVIYAPDGATALSRSSRSPQQSFSSFDLGGRREHAPFSHRKHPPDPLEPVLSALRKIAENHPAKNSDQPAIIQDFHSFKQALNVSSADQRLLVFTTLKSPQIETDKHPTFSVLQQSFNDPELLGRFHYDFLNPKADIHWRKSLTHTDRQTGVFIIQAHEFGQQGRILQSFPLTVTVSELKHSLLKHNQLFAASEVRKNYRQHIRKGKNLNINYRNTMPPGEDRDGDGVIDQRPHRGGKTPKLNRNRY